MKKRKVFLGRFHDISHGSLVLILKFIDREEYAELRIVSHSFNHVLEIGSALFNEYYTRSFIETLQSKQGLVVQGNKPHVIWTRNQSYNLETRRILYFYAYPTPYECFDCLVNQKVKPIKCKICENFICKTCTTHENPISCGCTICSKCYSHRTINCDICRSCTRCDSCSSGLGYCDSCSNLCCTDCRSGCADCGNICPRCLKKWSIMCATCKKKVCRSCNYNKKRVDSNGNWICWRH